MSFKFKEGQLVEVVRSKNRNEGRRFPITSSKYGNTVIDRNLRNIYKIPFEGVNGNPISWASEYDLKLVNPDGDNLSEENFEELLLNLKQGITV